MEIFLLIVVLGILISIVRSLSGNSRLLKQLQKDIDSFQKQLDRISSQSTEKPPGISPPPAPPVSRADPKPEIKTAIPPVQGEPVVEKKQVYIFDSNPEPAPVAPAIKYAGPARVVLPRPEQKPNWFSKWLHDNPDIEKFIGENLINKIGIAVLVLGIAFFVKYAIDQEWINKVGRVCIGLFCGAVLIGFAHRLRKNYHSFSSVLVGGGLTVFYFTIAFAFHQYQLFSQEAAFVIMIMITVFAVLLSILYDRIELGILATIGGFITPFLVSRGEGNYVVLFTYAGILNAGLIVLAYYKRWRILNFLGFVFTQAIYLGWLIDKSGQTDFPYRGTFFFGAIFYLMFVVMNVIHHVGRGSKLKAFDFIMLLSVNLFFYATGIYLMQQGGAASYKGLFTASLGIINLLLAYLFFRRSKADKNFIYLLIGITLTFISLTAPVQLKGHSITLFWSAEMVVLLWLYQKSFIPLLKIASVLISALMLASLFMDWSEIYSQDHVVFTILFNKGCITGFFSALAMFLMYRLLRREADTFFYWRITNSSLRSVYLVGAVGLAFCSGALEINDQFTKRFPGTGLQFIYLQFYVISFFLMLSGLLQKFKTKINKYLNLFFPLIIFALYVFNRFNTYFTETRLLVTGNSRPYFFVNWISALLLLFMGWQTIQYVRKNKADFSNALPRITWMISIAILVVLSIEIRNMFIWLNYSGLASIEHTETMYDKAGLTILWAVASFIMIWLGMSNKYKTLRIIALVVFGVTLLKLFAYDIRDIAPAGKIIAFILLGVLLLIISFMYQRLKKIIIDDARAPK